MQKVEKDGEGYYIIATLGKPLVQRVVAYLDHNFPDNGFEVKSFEGSERMFSIVASNIDQKTAEFLVGVVWVLCQLRVKGEEMVKYMTVSPSKVKPWW